MLQIGNGGWFVNPKRVSMVGPVVKIPNRANTWGFLVLIEGHKHEELFNQEAVAVATQKALLDAVAKELGAD